MLSRRTFLSATAALALAPSVRAADVDPARGVTLAHAELWRRFFDKHHVMLDYVDGPIPTAEDCRENRPNALAWWTPTENGSFFNGLYLAAMCERYRLLTEDKKAAADAAAKAQRLVDGLLTLASVGATPGFIARGLATDGKSHHALGSNDQTFPWFYGLWRYLKTPLPNGVARNRITDKMVEVAAALEKSDWRMPADAPPFDFRGTFAPHAWESAPRLLFLCQAMSDVTGDERWAKRYTRLLREPSPREPNVTRLSVCEQGIDAQGKRLQSWTQANSVAALRGLWEMESDPTVSQALETGLRRSVAAVTDRLSLFEKFDPDATPVFEPDWRKLNEWWKPQANEAEAVAVAQEQSKQLGRLSPRRTQEVSFVREPLFAAWIVTLCPDEAMINAHRGTIRAMLAHYPYDRLYYSQFFAAELAAYRLGIV